MLNQQTLMKFKQLKLYGMAAGFERQLTQSASYEIAFEERLGLLVDEEVTYRENRRLRRLVKMAKFKEPQACIEDIDYNAKRGIDKAQIASLANCEWVRARHKLLITGATGVGKTWMACAMGNQATRQGLSVIYTRMPRLFDDLRIAHGDGGYTKKLAQLTKVELLLIDDWGLKPMTSAERHDLMEIIEERHGSRATLIASQIPIDRWHDYIGNPTLADAILDRVLENAHKLLIKGESMRKAKSSTT